MISQAWRFIFIHVPKTGGNSVQSLLLPLSDDERITSPLQDGHDRFGVRGPLTPKKHARLQDYAARLGPSLAEYSVVVVFRRPFERIVSLYFSPHRWKGAAPAWNRDSFLALAARTPTTASFLTVDGMYRPPDIALRFDRLDEDFRDWVDAAGLPVAAQGGLAVLNRSADPGALRARVLADDDLRRRVEAMHRDDLALLSGRP